MGRVVKSERTNAGVCKGPVVTGSSSDILPGVQLPRAQAWTPSAVLVAVATVSGMASGCKEPLAHQPKQQWPPQACFLQKLQGRPQSGKLPLFIKTLEGTSYFQANRLFFFFFFVFGRFQGLSKARKRKHKQGI